MIMMMMMMMMMMLLRKLNLTPDPKSVCNNAVDCILCLILNSLFLSIQLCCIIDHF